MKQLLTAILFLTALSSNAQYFPGTSIPLNVGNGTHYTQKVPNTGFDNSNNLSLIAAKANTSDVDTAKNNLYGSLATKATLANLALRLNISDTATMLSAYQKLLTNPVTGTATINYIPLMSGSTTIGNSIIQQSSGKIGVGMVPTYPLTIAGNSDIFARGPLAIIANNLSNIGVGLNLDAVLAGGRNYSFISGGSGSYLSGGWGIYDVTLSAYRMSISNAGNFTVGPMSSSADVSASRIGSNGNMSVGNTYYKIAAPTNGMIVEGNVGIGITSPTQKFAVSGTAYITGNTQVGLLHFGTNSGYTSIIGTGTSGAVSTSNLQFRVADGALIYRMRGDGLFTMGGETSSFPALKRNAAILEAKLADESAYTDFKAKSYIANGKTSDDILQGDGSTSSKAILATKSNVSDSVKAAKDSVHIINSKVLKFYKQWNGTDSVKTLAADSTVIVDTLTDQTIRGQKNFRGSDSTYDKAPVGSEQMTTAGSGSGWTGNMVVGIVHTAGDATPFTGTLAAVVSNYYQITWTVTGYSAGTFSISFGGVSSNMTGLTASGVAGIQATTTGVNIVTPTSTLNTGATIIISIKQIGSTKAITKFSGFTSGVQELRVFGTTNFLFSNSGGLRYLSGTNNTGFAANVLGSLTIGNNNTGAGTNASASLISGNANTSVGSGAGQNNLYSSSNTFIGYADGQNTTGGNNTASGATAMFNNVTGANNVAYGVNAARYYTANASLTTVNNGTFIGYMTKALANNSTNELVIGYNGQGDGDNTSVIGNSSTTQIRIYGNTLYKTGTATVQWTSGTGSPESVVTANVGSMYTRTDGGAGTTLYVKESGTGNTGWIAK